MSEAGKIASDRRSDAFDHFAAPLAVAVVLVLAWSLAVRLLHASVFPSPLAVLRGLAELSRKGLLVRYTLASLSRVSAGFALAVIVGVPLGLCMGIYRDLAVALDPLVQALRSISPIAWIPLAIVVFGVGDRPTVILIFFAACLPLVLSTLNATRTVPEMYLRAGRNFGLGGARLVARVVLPAIVPELVVGLRTALGIAWLVLVAAEMIAVDSGLGYLIIDARNAGKRYDLVVAGMLLIGVIGLVLDGLARRLEVLPRLRWAFRPHGDSR